MLTAGLWSAAAAPALAGPIADPVIWSTDSGGNGHAYTYVDAAKTWATAQRDASAFEYSGVQGHLATVSSAAENDFLGTLAFNGWLGGSDEASEGDWRWTEGAEAGLAFWSGGTAGQPLAFANWHSGEPNNQGDEDYLDRNGGLWNDLPGWSTRGYYVEYDLATTRDLPEPGALALVATALLGGAAAARRRRPAPTAAPHSAAAKPTGRQRP